MRHDIVQCAERTLFCNLYQIITDTTGECDIPLRPDLQIDYPLDVVIRRNSNGNISYAVVEFSNPNGKAKFHTSILFDGEGDYGASIRSCAIPKISPTATRYQRGMAFLALMQYLITCGHINATYDFFIEQADKDYKMFNSHNVSLADKFVELTVKSSRFISNFN